MVVDTRVDERTLRELYFPAFERAVTESQPWTVMCGYNRLNGVWCSDHRWLLTTVLLTLALTLALTRTLTLILALALILPQPPSPKA